jgi:predicted AAA+ superfamily ATPase
MIARINSSRISEKLKRSPAVVLVGPRQCGKTTLAKTLPDIVYFDLERDSDRVRLDLEWPALVSDKKCIVLDEVQTMPELFPRLRSEIDGKRKENGRFLLLGSVAPSLMKQVAESLAGRLSLCEMTPFVATELPEAQWDRLWCYGGYPDGGVLDAKQFPTWQSDYLTLLVQRDFPVWGLPALPPVTMRLLKMLAAVQGQQWNASQIAKGMGLSYHTVNSYVEFLEQAFLIRRIPAWSGNILKRIVKSPRLYWRDSGLCHALLGLRARNALLEQPWVGSSWEGWVIEQILVAFQLAGIAVTPYWFRTQEQLEADLILEFGDERWVIEIKLTTLPKTDDFKGLKKVAELISATRAILVSRTREVVWGRKESSVHLHELLARIKKA